MIGSETPAAARKRDQRARDAARIEASKTAELLRLSPNCDNVTTTTQNSHTDIDIDIDIDKDIEEKSIKKNVDVTQAERRNIYFECKNHNVNKSEV